MFSPSGFLRSVSFLGLMSCAGARTHYDRVTPTACGAVCTDPLTRVERVDLPGNPQVGTIVHLRQLHPTLQESEAGEREIGRYQYEIFRELQRQVFQDVFVENIPPPLSCPADRPVAEGLSGQNVLDYYCMGGAPLYARSRSSVTLRPTQSREEAVAIAAAVLNSSLQELMDLNESFAPPHIFRFLRDHPGARAALVFGAGHDFADNFAQEYPDPARRPVLVSICWRVPSTWTMAAFINPHCPE